MSSVSSAEPTAQQNFNPSWMRTNVTANRGGFLSSGGGRVAGSGGGGSIFDDVGEDHSATAVLSSPIVSELSYTRERLLELAPTGLNMPDALRDQLFFNENNLPLVSNSPLSETEQKYQGNVNSSKAMSLLSPSDRAAIASGAAYGSGYGGGGGSGSGGSASSGLLQNGQTPTANRWTPKQPWSKTTPDRSIGGSTPRGGASGSVGRAGVFGRGGGRIGGDNGFGGSNGSARGGNNEEGSGERGYQPKFSALRRGGGAAGVGRGGSTSVASYNTRADALFNPNDPTDRPKNTTITKTRSESDEEDEEGGWSKVGATPRHSTNSTTPSASSERPAWARSESWIKRSEQQRQLHASSQPSSQQPPISHWNNRDVAGGDSAVWKDRNQMVASVKKTSTTESPTAPVPQPTAAAAPAQAQSTENEVTPADQHIPIPAYAPNSATWSNNPMGGGGIFYQLPQPGPAPPIVKEGPIEFYYVDPTDTRRGPFAKDQMSVWFKAGYFNDESLRVQRGEKGEYKTIGELKKENGVSTPFDYPEDVEKPRVVAAPLTGYPSAAGVNTTTAAAAATNPMFPLGGMGMWGQQPDLYAVMQTNFEQQMILERQRLMEEHQRRVAEEAKKMAEFQEAMYRQLSMQQELTNQQLREQELALQRHREELERREKDALAIQHQMEAEARELKERKAALEAEDRRKRQAEEQLLQEQQQREAAAKEAADRVRRAEEAAEKERIRLDAEARQAEETIRQLRLKQELETRQKVEEAARKKAEERERLAKEAASARQKAELDAVWTGVKATTVSISTTALQASAPPPPPPTSASAQAQPKQVSPSASDDSEGWMPIGKEVKHTKAAPWAAKVEEPVKTEKTLLEIQREEERQLKAEREQQAKLKVKDAKELKSSVAKEEKSASSWGGAKTWAAPDTGSSSKSYVSPFLDGPSLEAANKMQLQKKNSLPKLAPAAATVAAVPVVKATPPVSKANNKTAPGASTPKTAQKKKTQQEKAAEEFEAWFIRKFQQFSSAVDVPTLFSCIVGLENPNEVEDIVMSYLDESKTVKEFVREFIKRRIAMRAAGGRPDVDDLTSARTASAAPSDSNSGSNSNSGNGQGKKKKKTQKQVLDGNILGFRAAAASDRLNKGEIDAIPSTPVNPSRR